MMPGLDAWLFEGDPAVRWRVLRDLERASEVVWAPERARVATDGWGARLLAEQADDGGWGGGVYSPKWISTTYTLLHLLWLGLTPGHLAALRGCEQLWAWQARWRVPETCIESMLVRLASHFEYDADGLDSLVADLLDQQLADGGWNCATRTDKHKHSSFHTSIQALEALHTYAGAGGVIGVHEATERGREFFLRHRLYQSHRTGEVAIRSSVRFPAFPEWHFDVLRGARRGEGRWHTCSPYAGRQWFQLEPPGPSRWNTARALRVLRWWESD